MVDNAVVTALSFFKTALIVAVVSYVCWRSIIWFLRKQYGEYQKLILAIGQHDKIKGKFRLDKVSRDEYALDTMLNSIEYRDLLDWIERFNAMIGSSRMILDIRRTRQHGNYKIIIGELATAETKDGLVADVDWTKIPEIPNFQYKRIFGIPYGLEENPEWLHKFPIGINGSYNQVVYHSLSQDSMHIGFFGPTSAGKSTLIRTVIDGIARLDWPAQFVIIALTNSSDYRFMQIDPAAWQIYDKNAIDRQRHSLDEYLLANVCLITDIESALAVLRYIKKEKQQRESLLDRFFPETGDIYSLHKNHYYAEEFGNAKMHRIFVLFEDHTILEEQAKAGDKRMQEILGLSYQMVKDARKVGIGFLYALQEAQLAGFPIRRQLRIYSGAFATELQNEYAIGKKIMGPEIRGAWLRSHLGGSGAVPFVIPNKGQIDVAATLVTALANAPEVTLDRYADLVTGSQRKGKLHGDTFEKIMAGQIKELRLRENFDWEVS